MNQGDSPLSLTVEADTQGLEASLAETGRLGQQFARTLASSFADAAQAGRGLADVLETLAGRLEALALRQGLKGLEAGLEQLVSGVFSGGALDFGRAADGVRYAQPTDRTGTAPPVVVNVTTPDAESFRRSETQIAALVARAAALGQRNL